MLCRLCGSAHSSTTDGLCGRCQCFPVQPQPTVSWTCPTCGASHRYVAVVQEVATSERNAAHGLR